MENKSKNELGRIYGSRISKSGKWLNLIIAAKIEDKEIKITCPVRLYEYAENGKPYARVEMACNTKGEHYADKAVIADIAIFDDSKPKQEAKATEGAATEKPIFAKGDPNDDGLPF